MSKRGPGRPRLKRRTDVRKSYGIALNQSERDAIAKAAQQAGMRFVPWCRAVLLSAAESQPARDG